MDNNTIQGLRAFILLMISYTALCGGLSAQTYNILNNNRLRIGNGSENSINTQGNMQQPFYYNGSAYRKLTYSSYPLDIRWGIGGDGTNNWNTSGTIVENPVFTNQVYDYSNFTVTNAATGDGYGQIRTTGEITIGAQTFQVDNIYELLQPEGYIGIKVKITNTSGSSASNVRLWVGTRDDYVGGSDRPTKERGNLIDEQFVALTNQVDQAKAIKISTTEEAILFFSNSDRAYTTINRCCSFTNATNQDPATNAITETGDGSYALYVRFNDLAPNESEELIWYYAAGTLPEIDEIIARVANAAIGAFDNVTHTTADYAATSAESGTGYWVLVPDGSAVPTAAQIEAGVDYGGVGVVASGNSPMTADVEQVYNLTGLTPYTNYDFYFVVEYFDGANDAYTEIISEDLNTLEAPPVLTSFSPETAAYGEVITLTGSNFLTTSGVTIGGINAIYSVIDGNTVEATVPDGASDFYVTLTNESGSDSIDSQVTGSTEDSCSTGWSAAWQAITSLEEAMLRSVTLKLDNTDASNNYNLYLELHQTDANPSSANPDVKFSSLLATSDQITVSANTTAAEFEFVFANSIALVANTNYYVVLKENGANPPGTGNQGVYLSCDGNTNGGAGNNFGSLYHSFSTSPILKISNPPTAIAIAPSTIMENNGIGQVVGALTTTDADVDDVHIYALVAGIGDDDNTSFSISDSDLQANEIFDFEVKSSYNIRISTTDSDNNVYEGTLVINIDNNMDEDGDGVNDDVDNCPTIANADQLNTDGLNDGGDACDDDDDEDGTLDTEDAFPLDPTEDTDTDGDGMGDNSDAFPEDPTEDTDTDGDGVGDNSDAFPEDPNEDTDTDGDGTGDNADDDDDGDGTPDDEDAFPLDSTEDTDTDGDGVGDNADDDDDGDGTPDDEDAFPLDSTEDTDTDGDGVGDNSDAFPEDPNEDTDTDGDGVGDNSDAFPEDSNEDTDTDGDGTGDNADDDDDGDGTPDDEDAFPLDGNEDTDTDGDGVGDNADDDDDDDGTPDSEDAFPLDSNEDTDTDGDGVGDNSDAFPDNPNEDTDTDGDGIGDNSDAFPEDPNEDTDTDGDGVGDNSDAFPEDPNEDTDTDGDGVGDSSDAFPEDPNEDTDTDGDGIGDNSDVFPEDPNEDTDTDGDGIGDNADDDDDGDGTPDSEDDFPLDASEDTDTDGDGIGDNGDNDADGDGTPDEEDAFPLDPNEDTDSDGDGIGNNADEDDDGDGTPDSEDDFPLDASEDTDTDGDGVGDNADDDDDGDGTPDEEDAFPLDPNEDTDSDGDGIGNNADEDDDNDGIPDTTDAFPLNSAPKVRPAEAFTPNGDGMNDGWVIPGIDNYPNNTVKVYNRWGHVVYETKSYSNNWEGFYKDNREKLPSGSYLYVIDLGDGSAPIQGWVFLNY